MSNATNNPVLPFAVWHPEGSRAVDLLCLEAWQVDAYAVGPQPWYTWHSDGWTPERAVMELSTPTTRDPFGRDLEDDSHLLNHPTVTCNYVLRKITYAQNRAP